jgi:hypothetical protein
MGTWRTLSIIFIVLFAFTWVNRLDAAGGGGSRVAKEELIPAVVIVSKIGQTDIEIIYRKTNAFLPIITIFRYLNLRADYSAEKGELAGYYPTSVSPFSMNLISGQMKIRDTSVILASDEVTFSDDEVYLREDIFRSIFKLSIRYDSRRLAVLVNPPLNLPVFSARARERNRKKMMELNKIVEPDFYITREPSLFEMGKLNWSISNRMSKRATSRWTYDERLGGKILFGDLDFLIRGIVNRKVQEENIRGDLTYPFNEDGYLRKIRLGDVQPLGISYRGILGVEITNKPAARRLTFGTEEFNTRLQGNSEFEFYNRGMLTNFVKPGSDTVYRMTYPLSYGVDEMETRTYNQWGDLTRQRLRTIVPQSMLPQNYFQYNVVGGKIRGFKKAYGEISGAYGITKSLTVGAGSELYEQGFANRQVIPFITGTTRFTNSLVGEVVVSPLAVSHASLDLLTADQMRFTLTQYVYAKDPAFNLGGLLSSSTMFFNIPFTYESRDFVIGGYASNTLSQYTHQRSLSGTFGAHFPSFQLFYNLIYTQYNTESQGYKTNLAQSSIEASIMAPAAIIFRVGGDYDHLNTQVQSVRLGIEKILFKNFFLQLSYQRNFKPSYAFIFLQLNYNLPFLRFYSSNTRTLREGDDLGTVSTNTARGVLLFSTKTGDLMYNSVQQTDRGAILVNTFVDKNDNGTRDAGEDALPSARFVTRSLRLTASSVYNQKGLLITNVEPYQQYTTYIDPRFTFEDPMYVPKYTSLAIMGEPNVLKVVNYPILVGGNIHGTVLLSGPTGSPRPSEGITVILKSKHDEKGTLKTLRYMKTTRTFSTGEFEFHAVPPGTYEVSIDPADIQAFGLKTEASSREVIVGAKAEGDQVTGIDFILKQ